MSGCLGVLEGEVGRVKIRFFRFVLVGGLGFFGMI